jgi:hypothetical protein
MLDLSKPIELIGLDRHYQVNPEDIQDEGKTLWLRKSPIWMVALPRFKKDGSHFDVSIYQLTNKIEERDRTSDANALAVSLAWHPSDGAKHTSSH